jgi:hypothetical protein
MRCNLPTGKIGGNKAGILYEPTAFGKVTASGTDTWSCQGRRLGDKDSTKGIHGLCFRSPCGLDAAC